MVVKKIDNLYILKRAKRLLSAMPFLVDLRVYYFEELKK